MNPKYNTTYGNSSVSTPKKEKEEKKSPPYSLLFPFPILLLLIFLLLTSNTKKKKLTKNLRTTDLFVFSFNVYYIYCCSICLIGLF